MATSEPSPSARIVALRLHGRRASGGQPLPPRPQSLLDLKARTAARAADDEALRKLIATIGREVQNVPETVRARLDEVAGIAVELGLALAREIVGVALDQGLVDPTPTVARCLADCVHGADRGDLVVRLHPDDLAPVETRLQAMPELAEALAEARLVADRTVPRGGVRAETGAGRLRYDPSEVLERICAEVRREAAS